MKVTHQVGKLFCNDEELIQRQAPGSVRVSLSHDRLRFLCDSLGSGQMIRLQD